MGWIFAISLCETTNQSIMTSSFIMCHAHCCHQPARGVSCSEPKCAILYKTESHQMPSHYEHRSATNTGSPEAHIFDYHSANQDVSRHYSLSKRHPLPCDYAEYDTTLRRRPLFLIPIFCTRHNFFHGRRRLYLHRRRYRSSCDRHTQAGSTHVSSTRAEGEKYQPSWPKDRTHSTSIP